MTRVVFGAILSAGLVAAASGAALVNPGFETGDLSGWTTFGTGWRTGAGGDARSGTFGVLNDVLPSDGDTYRGIFQNVAVTEGSIYESGVYIRTVSIGNSESWFEFQFLNGSGGVISQFQSAYVTGDQAFTLAGIGMVTAPVGAVTASIRAIVHMPSAPADTDFQNFDDFFFNDVTPPDSGLTNPGFESDFSDWNTFGQGWRIGGGGDARSGGKGAVNDVLASDSDNFRGVFQNVPVAAGWNYRASVYIKGVSLQTSESWLEIQWLNSGGGLVSQDKSSNITADQGFVFLELNSLAAPAGAVTASVRAIVQMLSVPVDSDFHIVDDFNFGLKQAAVNGVLGSASIAFTNTTTVTGSGGSGDGDFEFRQNGGTGVITFGASGNPRTITPVSAGTAVIEVRRLGNVTFADSEWVSSGTLTVTKATPAVSIWPTAGTIAEGQPLGYSLLSGGTASVPGSFEFVTPSLKPSQGTASQSARFVPVDSNNYNSVVGSVSVTVNAPAVSGLSNHGFENDFTDWSTFGQGWRIGIGADANSGSKGAVNDVIPSDVDSFRGVFQIVPVSAGASYRASVYIRTALLESSESWLEIQWLNGGGGVISQDKSANVTADQGFALSALNNLVAPAGAVQASVRAIVNMLTAPGNADFHIFDDFNFGLLQTTVNGVLGSSSISFTGSTTVTGSGGSGSGSFEFRQNGGSGSVSFGASGNPRTITPVSAGTAVIQARRLGDQSYADSVWVSAGTLTITKVTPTVTAWPTASAIYEGQSLSVSVLSGGSASVSGTFSFVSPSDAPYEGTADQSVRFTPTDTGNYNTVDFVVSVTVNPPPDSSLTNPGFENGLNGWSTFGQGWRTGGGADARNGSLGAVDDVLSSDSDTFRGAFQNVPVIAGLAYSAGVYIKAVSIGSSESWLEIQWYNSGGGVISQETTAHVTSDQSFTLSGLSGIIAPAGAVTAGFRLIVYMPGAPADSDFHIFDDAYFVLSNGAAEITDFPLSSLSFSAKPGVVYKVLYTDNADPTAGSWTQQGTVESGNANASVAVTESSRRYFQIVPEGGSASSDERVMWGVIKPTVSQGYTMMSPPLKGNRDLHGEFGAALADGLTGNNNGTADRIMVRSGGGWREFYLHGSGSWYENGSPVSYTLTEGQGFYLYRNESTPATLRFSGQVGNQSESPVTISINTGWNIVGPSQGKNISFNSIVSGIPGASAGWDETSADMIILDEAPAGWRRIMRYSGGGWYDLKAGTFSPSITIQPGKAMYYYRKTSAGTTTMSF